MDAVLGVGLLTLTVLLFAWAYGEFRRPLPKAWTQSNLAATSITLAMTCLFAFSLVFAGNFLLSLDSETRWLEPAAVIGVALAVCWFLIPRLVAPARQAPPAPSPAPTGDAPPEPANDPRPTSPAQPGRPIGKPQRGRAA